MGLLKNKLTAADLDWLEATFVQNARIVAHERQRDDEQVDVDILRAKEIIGNVRVLLAVKATVKAECAT